MTTTVARHLRRQIRQESLYHTTTTHLQRRGGKAGTALAFGHRTTWETRPRRLPRSLRARLRALRYRHPMFAGKGASGRRLSIPRRNVFCGPLAFSVNPTISSITTATAVSPTSASTPVADRSFVTARFRFCRLGRRRLARPRRRQRFQHNYLYCNRRDGISKMSAMPLDSP